VLAGMNEWCQEHHNKSGLAQRVRDSTVSLQEAEQQVRADAQPTGCCHAAAGTNTWLLQSVSG
jgi:oligoribonuclease